MAMLSAICLPGGVAEANGSEGTRTRWVVNFGYQGYEDFNFILHDNEKYSTQPLDNVESNLFSNKIIDLDLNDLGSTGCPFTWSNKKSGPALTEQRLDKGLATESWMLMYPNSTITNLLAIGSDHHPILLNTNLTWSTGKIPFKFFGPWLDHKDCKDIIAEC
ncbi:uncharacterized protein LOC113333602 [Papaver somniferum]|uniref:uncharacterized protein LOC113333602 n=1 Tax=Papaver somniferum TaxID=3469 RepID=UPI000E6F636D|nr:uncharacterized protein LOC113333602 [Papaver somniferum]